MRATTLNTGSTIRHIVDSTSCPYMNLGLQSYGPAIQLTLDSVLPAGPHRRRHLTPQHACRDTEGASELREQLLQQVEVQLLVQRATHRSLAAFGKQSWAQAAVASTPRRDGSAVTANADVSGALWGRGAVLDEDADTADADVSGARRRGVALLDGKAEGRLEGQGGVADTADADISGARRRGIALVDGEADGRAEGQDGGVAATATGGAEGAGQGGRVTAVAAEVRGEVSGGKIAGGELGGADGAVIGGQEEELMEHRQGGEEDEVDGVHGCGDGLAGEGAVEGREGDGDDGQGFSAAQGDVTDMALGGIQVKGGNRSRRWTVGSGLGR